MNTSYKELLAYCKTERQKEIIQTIIDCNGIRSASKKLKISRRSIQLTLSVIKKNAVLQGYSPEHGLTHEIPTPLCIKGTSTLYNKDGEISAQWIKTTVNQNELSKYIQEIIEASLSDIKPVTISDCNCKDNDPDTLTIYPIADLHIGMLSWLNESGNDYDLEIVEDVFRQIFTKLIERSPKSKQALICQLGDWIHVDNLRNETERNGNPLDTDSRYCKIYMVAMKLIRFVIETAASKHKEVHVINCMGNHDDMGALTMNIALQNIYENNPRIHILNNASSRQYFRFGNNLIGATHGYDCGAKDLPIVMATERKEDWGQTDFHYFYCGHIHQDKLLEVCGCKVESFRTIAARDAWTNSKGYLSGRDLKAIVIHKDVGEVERYTISTNPDLYIKVK